MTIFIYNPAVPANGVNNPIMYPSKKIPFTFSKVLLSLSLLK
jgi:hypothetical protein